MNDRTTVVSFDDETKARQQGEVPFGDVMLKYGHAGWYIKGYSRLGYKQTLDEMKEAVELLAIESILNELCEQGLMERVS